MAALTAPAAMATVTVRPEKRSRMMTSFAVQLSYYSEIPPWTTSALCVAWSKCTAVRFPGKRRFCVAYLRNVSSGPNFVNARRGRASVESCCRFAFAQRGLSCDAPAIARQFAVGARHPVAGNRDRDLVRRAGLRHCAHRSGLPDPPREFRVGRLRSCRNFAQRFPDPLLEGCAAHVQRQMKAAPRRLNEA